MIPQKRILVFGSVFVLAVFADWLKFMAVGESNIVNWYSFVHPAWVITTLALLFVGAFWFTHTTKYWFALFLLHFLVVAGAFINQYFPFWETLTYNCMLFNLIFTAAYFMVSAPRQSS